MFRNFKETPTIKVRVSSTADKLGKAAGTKAAQLITETIIEKGNANIILATGVSQFATLNQLVAESNVDWSKVTMFHLDEYIGLPLTHPASFRKYLLDRFVSKVPALASYHLINGEGDVKKECERLGKLITENSIDVALVGIGENGHLAFNDPPADFETEKQYIVVQLDEVCRRQQVAEGWFSGLDEVPRQAISMSVKQILKSKHIICSVPDERKAVAVRNCLENPVSNLFPASALQSHPGCTCFLDAASASLLSK